MYEEYYAAVPDIDAYLARIGIHERKEPTLSWLNEILWEHQLHVPFENISEYDEKAEVPLGISRLYEKIVLHRRGGYCFELNGLLLKVLQELGYAATACHQSFP